MDREVREKWGRERERGQWCMVKREKEDERKEDRAL